MQIDREKITLEKITITLVGEEIARFIEALTLANDNIDDPIKSQYIWALLARLRGIA